MSIECSGGKLRTSAGAVRLRRGCDAVAGPRERGEQRPRRLWAALIKFMATSPLKQY